MKTPVWTNASYQIDIAKMAKESGLSKAAVKKLFETKPSMKHPPPKTAQCVRSIVEFGRREIVPTVYGDDNSLDPYMQKHALSVCKAAKAQGFHSRKRIRWTGIRLMKNLQSPCADYRATASEDGSFDYVNNGDEIMSLQITKWTPSIFMPRAFSRITLEVTDVRVERLQAITNEDALLEGAIASYDQSCGAQLPVHAFADLWEKLNKPRGYGWDVNPWVWVVSFRRINA